MIVLTDKRKEPFQIDEADYEAVSRYSWHVDGSGYVSTDIGKYPTCKSLMLHHFLLGKAPEGLEWDHINRDKKDNRRQNLRAVTQSVNMRNKKAGKNNSTGIRGVVWHKQCRKFKAQIRVGNAMRYLGLHPTVEAAAAVRAAAEREFWGDAQ